MVASPATIAVFPLPIFLLPRGITRLVIFEPRYQRLISEAVQNNGFALSYFDKTLPFEISLNAALVDIIDFSALVDGTLTVDVKARTLVTLSHVWTEPDGLKRAEYSPFAHWSESEELRLGRGGAALADMLKKIIDDEKHLLELYPDPQFEDLSWVFARYIELLPLTYKQKQTLIFEQNYEQLENFLRTVVFGHDHGYL